MQAMIFGGARPVIGMIGVQDDSDLGPSTPTNSFPAITLGANTKSIVVIAGGMKGDSTAIGTVSCTYGGVSMTQIMTAAKSTSTTREGRLAAFYLNGPPTGSKQIQLTWTTSAAGESQQYALFELNSNVRTVFDTTSDTTGTGISLSPATTNNKRGLFFYAAYADDDDEYFLSGTGVTSLKSVYTVLGFRIFGYAYANNNGSSVSASALNMGTYPLGIAFSVSA